MYRLGLIAMTQVRDIMEKNVITIDKNKTALDVATILKEKEISFLVVMNEGKPSGIVSERDIVRKIAAEDLTASSIKLEAVMSNKFRWVEPDTKIEFAVQKMINNNIRRLLVLENENLVGVITQTNLTEFLRSKILINSTIENVESKNTQ
jgi:CBS domain-containing protein